MKILGLINMQATLFNLWAVSKLVKVSWVMGIDMIWDSDSQINGSILEKFLNIPFCKAFFYIINS